MSELSETHKTPSQQASDEMNDNAEETQDSSAEDTHKTCSLLDPAAGKLVTALQEFVSSMIAKSRLDASDGVEVDLKVPHKTASAPEDITSSPEAPVLIIDGVHSTPSSLELEPALKQVKYQVFTQRFHKALRERVFSTMPIRLLYFTPTKQASKLQITLLDRFSVCGKIIEQIEADYSVRRFEMDISVQTQRSRPGKELEDRQTAENDLIKKWVWSYTKYAILSHTWLRGGEVTFGAWNTRQFDASKPGFQKLANFCETSRRNHGIVFGWMDTVCINKESSSELDESIRSMYKWYRTSSVCITYLAETATLPDMHKDPWFSRGWTFQELLAPPNIVFYNRDWQRLITRQHFSGIDKLNDDILDQIHKATTITESELRSPQHMSISRKMQLAARREVTREEDTAYSLMGICGVSISIAYGEGAQRAFYRLMTEIFNSSKEVFDLFNCAQDADASLGSSIIPSSPAAYVQRSARLNVGGPDQLNPIEPLVLTHLGLRIPILLLPGIPSDSPAFTGDPIGDYYARVELPKRAPDDYPQIFGLLDKGVRSPAEAGPSSVLSSSGARPGWGYRSNMMFGVLNFGGDKKNVQVPNTCLAIAFRGDASTQWESATSAAQHPTREPITFNLMTRNDVKNANDVYHTRYWIQLDMLEWHGMKLVTMYL